MGTKIKEQYILRFRERGSLLVINRLVVRKEQTQIDCDDGSFCFSKTDEAHEPQD